MFVLDTNVLSEMRRIRLGRGNLNVQAWADSVTPEALFLSAITIEELEIGVLREERRDPRQGSLLRAWLNGYVLPAFVDRILPIDATIAQLSASFRVPDPHPIRDGPIAATALVHGMTVVTRNGIHFENTGVSLLNPWQS